MKDNVDSTKQAILQLLLHKQSDSIKKKCDYLIFGRVGKN